MKKRLLPSVFASVALALCAQRASAVLLGTWNFNDSNLIVDQGTGTLTIDPTLDFSNGGGSSFAPGSTVNALGITPAGNALQIKSNANNGKFLQFAINTTGHQNLIMSLAATRHPQGFDINSVSYSTDGGTSFSSAGVVGTTPFDPGVAYSAHSFDFSGIAGLKNLANALVRITVDSATNNGATIDFDNIHFNADEIAPPPLPTPPATIGLTLAAADAVIITGGSTNVDAQVSNTAAPGAAGLDYTISGSGVATGLLPADGVAAPGDSNNHSTSFTGSDIGLQLGSATVTDPAATSSPVNADVNVTVLDHSNPVLTTLLIDFGTLVVSGADATESFGIDNLAGVFGESLTAGLDLISFEEIGDDSNVLSGTFATNLLAFADKAAGSASSFFDIVFDRDVVGSFSATYRMHFADQNLPGGVSRGSLDLLVQGQVISERTDFPNDPPPQPPTSAPTPEPGTAGLAVLAALALGKRRREA